MQAVSRQYPENSLKSIGYEVIRNTIAVLVGCALCIAIVASGDELETEHFLEIDVDNVAFPEVGEGLDASRPVSTRKGEWVFSVSQEQDRQILSAKSVDKLVTQSITPNSTHKRFVFDLKRQRFEPMRQEIRIESTDNKVLEEIEKLSGVSGVKRYQELGFSIVKIDVDINPVDILRALRTGFDDEDARILTGFFDDEPM